MFEGFDTPRENWSKLPHVFIENLPLIETIGEMKVILYILRHTWGFQDSEKKITLDEFQHGRKRRDRTRLDKGTGLSKPTIIDGLRRAEEHGYINVETDDSDGGRIKKIYSLRMTDVNEVYPTSKPTSHRSEKETNGKKLTTMSPTGEDSFLPGEGVGTGKSLPVLSNQPAIIESPVPGIHSPEPDELPGIQTLDVDTPGAAAVFTAINTERQAIHRNPVKVKFPSMALKEKFITAERVLGLDDCRSFGEKAVENGIGAVTQVLQYVIKCSIPSRKPWDIAEVVIEGGVTKEKIGAVRGSSRVVDGKKIIQIQTNGPVKNRRTVLQGDVL